MNLWLTGRPLRHPTRHGPASPADAHSSTAFSSVELSLGHIEACIAERGRNRGCGVLVCGPDRHSLMNHVRGYRTGNDVMKAVIERLETVTRSDELIAPLPGAEVVIIVPDVLTMRDLMILAERAVAALQAPVTLPDGTHHRATVSVGIAATFNGVASAASLLGDAGRARSQAESRGGDRILVATPEDRQAAESRFLVEQDLRLALEEDQFLVHYQPIVDLRTGRVEGFEALVRWQHPVRRLLYPGSFLPEVVSLGLAGELGRFVLRTACRQAALWTAKVGRPLSMSINVDRRQLLETNLAAVVVETLDSSGLPAELLSLEISEQVLVEADEHLASVLRRLHLLGIGLSVDNGTGDPAALGSLASTGQRRSADSYKLDRALLDDPADEHLQQVVARAAELGGGSLAVVAQGIEHERHVVRALTRGAGLGQGFWIQRPVAAERLDQFVVEGCAHLHSAVGEAVSLER